MQLDESLRWQNVLVFLAMDIWQPYSHHLWLDVEKGHAIRDGIRKTQNLGSSSSELDLREYMYSALNDLKSELNIDVYCYFWNWAEHVFIHRGKDRRAEFWWEQLSRHLILAKWKGWVPDDVYAALTAALESHRRYLKEVDAILEQTKTDSLSKWDVSEFERVPLLTPDAMLTKINVIASQNAFCRAWYENCASRGNEFLHRLFEIAIVLLEEGELDMNLSHEKLPFPSSWELQCPKAFVLGNFGKSGVGTCEEIEGWRGRV